MSKSIRRRRIQHLLLVVLSAIIVAMLWLAGLQTGLALPRSVQTFVLTTVSDFNSGTALRTSIVDNIDGEIELAPLGVTGKWVTDTQTLPTARMQAVVVNNGNRIYVIGGVDNSSFSQADVFSSTVIGSNLSPWVKQSQSLPVALSGATGNVATTGGVTRVYVLGGQTASFVISNKIYYAPLNADGSLGAWSTNAVTLPVGVFFASSVVNRNYIYIIGGMDSLNKLHNEVYRAPINGDGSIGTWALVSTLPKANALSAAVAFDGTNADTLYVLGGATSLISNTSDVYFADVNPADGTLSAWSTSTGVLPEAFSSHAAVQANGVIYVVGGNSGGFAGQQTARQVVLCALVDENNPTRRLVDFGGGQSSWIQTDPVPQPRLWHGAVLVNGQIFVVGGGGPDSGSGITPSVLTFHGPISGAGKSYAPSGSYSGPVIDVGGNIPLIDLSWSTAILDQSALTITVRYHTSTNGISWFPYSAMLPSSSATSVSLADAKAVTYTLNTVARYLQYQVLMTTTVYTLTPFFTESRLRAQPPPPDLAVSKSAQASVVLPGNLITYTIAYSNLVGGPALGVVLTETVPVHTSFVSAGPGWQAAGNGQYINAIGGMSPGSSASTYFVVRVDSAPGVSAVTNIVSIGGDPTETQLGNNSATVQTQLQPLVNGIDLQVNVDDGLTYPAAGQVLTYVVSYANLGNTAANSARLTETLPAHTTYVGGPEWTAVAGNQYAHDLGTLGSAASGSIQFLALLDPNTPANSQLVNTAAIGSAGIDAVPSNNSASDVDLVLPPNIVVSLDDGTAIVAPNQILTYTITYRNAGKSVASNVLLTETLPPGSLLNALSTTGWAPNGSQLTRNLGSVVPGGTGNLNFVVQVNGGLSNGATVTDSVTATTAGEDPATLGDNSARDVDIVATGGAPDLQIVGARAQFATLGQPASIVVTVTNAGSVAATTWFFVDLYADRVPLARTDLGDTFLVSPGTLGPGQSQLLYFNWVFTSPGTHDLYFQADTCDTSPSDCTDPSYGRIAESNESNNTYGPLAVNVASAGSQLYLPAISR